MNDKTKRAYRYLLYKAMSDLRQYESVNSTEAPEILMSELQSVGGLSYWLHKLALASADDFHGFREESFWRQMRHFESKYPRLNLSRYKKIFEKELAASPKVAFKLTNFFKRISYSKQYKSIKLERVEAKN